ncbi:MAG: type II secretion system protein GspL [Gallionella sp.]|jgi:general secretion pathway protein L
MNVLRIYFSAQWRDNSSPCPWALCDESGAVLQQGLSPLAAIPKNRDCIGIVAADRVLTFTTTKPPGNQRRWQSALPFIAEEHTLTDPEDIHAVPADAKESGTIAVSVMAKSWLKQIIAATAAAGLPLRRLIAESLMPVLPADSWTLVWDVHNGFLRTSLTTGLALDSGNQEAPPLTLLLSLTDAGVNAPRQIVLRYMQSASPAILPSWDLPVPLVLGETWNWQCAPISDATPNLLWGDFTPPMRLFDGLPKLRPALFILLAALTIEVAGTHIEWAMLASDKQTLTQNIEHIFRGTFGDDSTLVDAPLQMQRNLANLRHAAGVTDDADFLSLLDTATPSLGTAVRGLNYESGKLELDIKLAKSADFETLAKKLTHSGLRVRTSDMHDLGDGTEAKLTLSLEGLR